MGKTLNNLLKNLKRNKRYETLQKQIWRYI